MYSLSIWTKPGTTETRIYINGTTRQKVYFCAGRNGETLWASATSTTPHKYQTGDHYGKVRKDQAAAHEVAEAYGIVLGETTYADALEIARSGLEI